MWMAANSILLTPVLTPHLPSQRYLFIQPNKLLTGTRSVEGRRTFSHTDQAIPFSWGKKICCLSKWEKLSLNHFPSSVIQQYSQGSQKHLVSSHPLLVTSPIVTELGYLHAILYMNCLLLMSKYLEI